MRCRVVIFLLDDLDSTARAPPVLVLLPEETVGRMSRDVIVFAFVVSRVILAVGTVLLAALLAACFFCARVFPAGPSSLCVNRNADLRFLRCFAFFLPACSMAATFFSTLGDDAVGTLGTCCVGALIDRVTRWLGSGASCPWSVAVAAGLTSLCTRSTGKFNLLATSAFVAIASSVRRCNCSISSVPLLLPIALIAFAHSAIAAMILSACVTVGLVIFLWLTCAVSVSRSLLVSSVLFCQGC